MPYGTIKVDNIVFTNSGIDQTIGVSGLVQSISGNLTATGTISGNVVRGTTVSGATVTGGAGQFTTITGGVLSVTSGVFAPGTSGAPSISFSSDSNTGFWSPAGDTVAISTGGSERIRIDSAGDLGVGTTDPTSRLTVRADAASGPNTIIRVENRAVSAGVTTQNIKVEGIFDYNNGTSDASAGAIVFGKDGTYTTATTNNDSYLAFETATDNSSTEKLRIDSSGRLLVGASAGVAVGSTSQAVFQATAGTTGNLSASIYSAVNSATWGAVIALGHGRATTSGILLADDLIGQIRFAGADGTDLESLAGSISAFVDGTPGANDMPGRLIFSTTADGAASPTERMRIDSAGNVGIGATTFTFGTGSGLLIQRDSVATVRVFSNSNGKALELTANATGGLVSARGTGSALVFESDATERARIDSSGRLLVGLSSGAALVHIGNSVDNLFMDRNESVAGGPNASFRKSRGTSGAPTIVNDGDFTGALQFRGYDGAAYITNATIRGEVDGTPGTNDMPGRLVFSTTADGAASPTERLRLDSSGRLGLGTSSPQALLEVSSATGANPPTPTEIRIRTSTSAATWSTTDPWGRLSFYSADATAGGARIHSSIETIAANSTGQSSDLVFKTSPDSGSSLDERVRISQTGRVGIGTTSPSQLLQVNGNALIGATPTTQYSNLTVVGTSGIQAAAPLFNLTNVAGTTRFAYIQHTGTGGDFFLLNQEAGALRFGTNNAERARIDSLGRLLVGTSTSVATSALNAGLQISNLATGNGASISIARYSNDAGASEFIFGKSRSGINASPGGIIQNGDTLGVIRWVGDNGTDLSSSAATILAAVDGEPGTAGDLTDIPARLVFTTSPDGAAGPTERMRIDSAGTTTLTSASATAPFISKISTSEVARIDSSGRLLVGTSTPSSGALGSGSLEVYSQSSLENTHVLLHHNSNSGSRFANLEFLKTHNNAVVLTGNTLGRLRWSGYDGTSAVTAALIESAVDGTPGTNDMPGRLVFSTTADGAASPTERMRIDSSGRIGFNNTNLGGASGNYRFGGIISGAASSSGILYTPTIQPDATTTASLFQTQPSTASNGAVPYAITNLFHYQTVQGTFNVDSTVTNQYGFGVNSSLTGATNNFGFYSNLSSAAGRWNFYAASTADSYFASNNFIFANGGTERARIDSSGRLLVGTSSSITTNIDGLSYGSIKSQLAGIDGNNGTQLIAQYSNVTAFSPTLALARSVAATVGAHTAVTGGVPIGRVSAAGSDGTTFIEGGRIDFVADALFTTNSAPTRLVFFTTANGASSPTERMRIDSAGRVGIGTNNPGKTLHVAGDARIGAADSNDCSIELGEGATGNRAAFIDFVSDTTYTDFGLRIRRNNGGANTDSNINHRGTGSLVLNALDAGSVSVSSNGSERARIDSSGRLLVGASTSVSQFGVAPQIQSTGTSGAGGYLGLTVFNTAVDSAPNLVLGHSKGATVGTYTASVAEDLLGEITFTAANGTDMRRGASIGAWADAGWGTNDHPARLVFSTTFDAGSGPTEAFRITNDRVHCYNQAAPAAVDTTATLTVANLKTGIITSTTAAAVTMTLPTGTDTQAGFSGTYDNMTFEWSVINTGATNAVTVQGNTGHTLVGTGTVAASSSGRFASRRTAANTFVTYRLSS